jgi:hypothetical protein
MKYIFFVKIELDFFNEKCYFLFSKSILSEYLLANLSNFLASSGQINRKKLLFNNEIDMNKTFLTKKNIFFDI